MDRTSAPWEPTGSNATQLALSVRAMGRMLTAAYEDPQPEALARLHGVVAILDRVSKQ